MNYITDGTFWIVAAILAGTIWGVWYMLKKEIDKTRNDLNETKKIIASGAHELSDAFKEDDKERNAKMEEIVDVLAILTKEITILKKSADKKTRDEMDKAFAEYKKHAE